MNGQIVFDPLLPWAAIAILAALALLGTGLALWRGLSGWALRFLAGVILVGALAQPSYQVEDRAPLSDIVLMLVDETASQQLAERADITTEAAARLEAQLDARPNTEVRRIPVPDGEGDAGTLLMTALSNALAEEP
ncbi:MAG: hypothetical protein KI788_23610, partial [Mameliella sp.]|nr:hypothetical protein [Mameliella sp.]